MSKAKTNSVLIQAIKGVLIGLLFGLLGILAWITFILGIVLAVILSKSGIITKIVCIIIIIISEILYTIFFRELYVLANYFVMYFTGFVIGWAICQFFMEKKMIPHEEKQYNRTQEERKSKGLKDGKQIIIVSDNKNKNNFSIIMKSIGKVSLFAFINSILFGTSLTIYYLFLNSTLTITEIEVKNIFIILNLTGSSIAAIGNFILLLLIYRLLRNSKGNSNSIIDQVFQGFKISQIVKLSHNILTIFIFIAEVTKYTYLSMGASYLFSSMSFGINYLFSSFIKMMGVVIEILTLMKILRFLTNTEKQRLITIVLILIDIIILIFSYLPISTLMYLYFGESITLIFYMVGFYIFGQKKREILSNIEN
ncbi:MAG: hypothetical protein ACTSWY_12270 [Promethearchaeota archaeon]